MKAPEEEFRVTLFDRTSIEAKARLHSKTPEEATDHFGWFAHFAALDNPASSHRTRQLLGWQPTQPRLIPDLDRSRYFEN